MDKFAGNESLGNGIISYPTQYQNNNTNHHFSKKLIDNYLIGLILILLVVILLKIYSIRKSQKGIVEKLHDAGWRLYVMDGCKFCEEQLMILGTGKYPDMVNCSDSTKHCPIDFKAFPAWKNTKTQGALIYGVQHLPNLSAMAVGNLKGAKYDTTIY